MEFYFTVFAFVLVVRTCGQLSTTHVEQSESVSSYTNTSTSHPDPQRLCSVIELDVKDVNFLTNGNMFIPEHNATIGPSNMQITENGRKICFTVTATLRKDIFQRCGTFEYNKDEFRKLSNGSILLMNALLEDEALYEINEEGKLVLCSMDYDDVDEEEFINLLPKPMDDVEKASMYIGQIGNVISIFALLAHIVIFCLVPSLRNLPGYNLLSLSIAFLLAYSFTLIGQVRQVLGTFCIICAILQQYFFLVAFFWMNAMAFDVWKTLKMATEKLMVSSSIARHHQLLWYSSYAWLVPMCIVAVTVGVDNSKNVPDKIKPLFGKNSLCWFSNDIAKGIFFSLPAFVLFLINAVFFVLSAFILKNNTMQQADATEHCQTVKFNYILYVRLALMMGVTWLIGAIGIILSNDGSSHHGLDTVVWFLFDILNSSQGLFVFLLFTCSRKVFRHLLDRMSISIFKTEADRHTFSDTTKCNRDSSKCDVKKCDF